MVEVPPKASAAQLVNIAHANGLELVDFTTAFVKLEAKVAAFEEHRSELSEEIPLDRFLGVVEEYQELSASIRKIELAATLYKTEDITNDDAISVHKQMVTHRSNALSRIEFFTRWLKGIPSTDLPGLSAERRTALINLSGKHENALKDLSRTDPRPVTPDVEERLLRARSESQNAYATQYDLDFNRFRYQFTPGEAPIRHHEIEDHMYALGRTDRARAYELMMAKLAEHSEHLVSLVRGAVESWDNEAKERGYPEPISLRNSWNRIPDPVITAMLGAVWDNLPLLQHYLVTKGKLLPIERMNRVDVYAGIGRVAPDTDHADSVRQILSAFDDFSPEIGDATREIIRAGHVHSLETPGKEFGARSFHAGASMNPFVLLNEGTRLKTKVTRAHEFGHAFHGRVIRNGPRGMPFTAWIIPSGNSSKSTTTTL